MPHGFVKSSQQEPSPTKNVMTPGIHNESRIVRPNETPQEGLLWSKPQTTLESYDVFFPDVMTFQHELSWLNGSEPLELIAEQNKTERTAVLLRIHTSKRHRFFGEYYVAQLFGGALVTTNGCVL